MESPGLFPQEWSAENLRATLPEDVDDYVEVLGRWLAAQVPADPPRVALHTNPGPTHTFVDAGRFTGLIEVGDACLGRPVLDLWRWTRPADRRALLDGYVAAGPTLPPAFWARWPVGEVLADLLGGLRRDSEAAASVRHLAAVLDRA